MYSDIVKNILNIPYCNFDNIDIKTQYEIVTGISYMYDKYPFFNHVLCALEQPNDFIYHYNMYIYTMNGKKEYDDSSLDSGSKICSFYSISLMNEYSDLYNLPDKIDNSFADYFSIVFFDNINEYNFNRKIIFHEFGHLLDNFLHISSDKDFLELIKDYDIKNDIFVYSCDDICELVAEAFALYNMSILNKQDSSNIINLIGKFIDKKYNEFVNNNWYKDYNFNLRYSISLKK